MTQRYFDDEDLAMLKEVLDANVPSAIDGPWTRRLQKEFAAATEAKYAVAVNSGMSALHACLAAADAALYDAKKNNRDCIRIYSPQQAA